MNILDFQLERMNRDERLSEVIARAKACGFDVHTDDRGYLVFEYSRPFIVPVERRPAMERLHKIARTMDEHEHNMKKWRNDNA